MLLLQLLHQFLLQHLLQVVFSSSLWSWVNPLEEWAAFLDDAHTQALYTQCNTMVRKRIYASCLYFFSLQLSYVWTQIWPEVCEIFSIFRTHRVFEWCDLLSYTHVWQEKRRGNVYLFLCLQLLYSSTIEDLCDTGDSSTCLSVTHLTYFVLSFFARSFSPHSTIGRTFHFALASKQKRMSARSRSARSISARGKYQCKLHQAVCCTISLHNLPITRSLITRLSMFPFASFVEHM